MEHHYLLSILSINLRNIGKLSWAIIVLTEEGLCFKGLCGNNLLFRIHFAFSSKGKITRSFRSEADVSQLSLLAGLHSVKNSYVF